MKQLIDIVNFNSDASCLSSTKWIAALSGGRGSSLYRWTDLYVRHRRKVVLGFTGGTLADIRAFNPEVLELINAHPEIFGAVARPFSHDIHLLRRPRSFVYNLRAGVRAREITLPRLKRPQCYLPPEFMLTGEQVGLLAEAGITSVLINAARFKADDQRRIPSHPYLLRGLLGTRLGAIPLDGGLTLKYLHSMQAFDEDQWHAAVLDCKANPAVLWRDGESSFLLPDGVTHEEYWLANESRDVERWLLEDWTPAFEKPGEDDESVVEHFPVHSFAAWMKEFRMLGFLGRLGEFEDRCIEGPAEEIALWMGLINSDVLSAVEKRPVKVALRAGPKSNGTKECVLHRSRREFEAEEYLTLLGKLRAGEDAWRHVEASPDAHMKKLHARALLLRDIPAE